MSNLEAVNDPAFTLMGSDGLRSIHQPIPLCPRQWKGTISEKQSQLFEKPWLCDSSKTQSEIQDQICLFILLDMSSKQHSFSKTTLVRSPPGVMFRFRAAASSACEAIGAPRPSAAPPSLHAPNDDEGTDLRPETMMFTGQM